MSTEIKVIDASEIESKNVEVGEWGLEFKGQLTPDEWFEVAKSVQKFDGKLQWYLGDLAMYAESPVTGFDAKKEKTDKSKYDELIEATGYRRDTLMVLASICRRFSASFRGSVLSRDKTGTLSFSHFRAVAPFKEDAFAEYWLIKASENGWGQKKLQEEINKEYGKERGKSEKSVGESTFGEQMKSFFKGYMVDHNKSYDDVSWLLEVHDVIEEKLSHDYGIEL